MHSGHGTGTILKVGWTVLGPIITVHWHDKPAVPRREGGVIPGNVDWIEGYEACAPFLDHTSTRSPSAT